MISMPNEFVQPVHSLGEAGDPGVSPMGDVPQFLYDRGFVGILAAAARHLREDIAAKGLVERGWNRSRIWSGSR